MSGKVKLQVKLSMMLGRTWSIRSGMYILFVIFLMALIAMTIINEKLIHTETGSRLQIAYHVAFDCSGNKEMIVKFYTEDAADVKIYDGETIIWEHQLVYTGSKLMSRDGSIEFWSEGDETMSTFIKEDGVITFRCKFDTNIE